MCGGGNKHSIVTEPTHTRRQANPEHTRRLPCHVRARRAARALHDSRHSKTKQRRKAKRREEQRTREGSVRRWRRSSRRRLRRATTQHKHKRKKRTTVSRTSTREHKQFRKQVLARAQAMGITHCPACGVKLQYNNNGQRKPNSAEADHIIPASLGGTNHPDNGRVLCAKCNSRRGNGKHGKGRARHYQKNENERDRLPVAVMPTQHTDTW